MRTGRYDYFVYFWTPQGDPICHFYYDEIRSWESMEKSWKNFNIGAHVVKVVDTQTGQILYERAKT